MRQKILLTAIGILCLGLLAAFQPRAHATVVNLKFANFYPPPAKQSKICEEFIKDLEMRTKGGIKVTYYGGGSLLKGPGMYKGIVGGVADIGYTHVYYTPGRMPLTEMSGMPLGNQSGWVASHALNDFYFKFRPKEWDEIKVLWLNGSGPADVLSKKPVRKLEDLKGLTIRGPGVPGDILKALGATPAPTPIVEVYDAIAKGVNDGAFGVYEMLKTFRLAEVVKYTTSTWQIGSNWPFYLAMNKNSYKKLPPDLKEIFDELTGEYRERIALLWNEVDIEGVNFGKEKGVEFIELSDAEVEKWKKAVEPLIEDSVKKLVKEGFAESEVRGAMSFLRERYEYYTAKQIEYRIPSPTGPAAMRPENIGK